MQQATKQTEVCTKTAIVAIAGETKAAREWAVINGVKWQTVKMRRYRGWPWPKAVGPKRQKISCSQRCCVCGK